MADWIPFLTTIVAAAVALSGYAFNLYGVRRERRVRFYADSLLAVKEFEELPYRIAKRPDSSPETRTQLGSLTNDAFVKLSYYQAWLRIDSPTVSVAYDNLARKAARVGRHQQRHAWRGQPISSDDQMVLPSMYYYGTKDELEACIFAMRRELSLFAKFRRKSTLVIIGSVKATPELQEGIDYTSAVSLNEPQERQA